jgi:polyhydroxybutyrate depolymerase
MIRTFLLFVVIFTLGCNKDDDNPNPSNPNIIPYQEGLTTNYITINNITRKYLVYRPTGMIAVNAVVTVLHGGGGLGIGVSEIGAHPLSVFRTIADNEKFLVVYPEGSLDIQGNPGWNDCRSDDISGSQGDDITFLLIQTKCF